jgi:hypothetical protein
MVASPQQEFIKKTRGDVRLAQNVILKFREAQKDMQKRSPGERFTGVPSAELIQIQNLYSDKGKEGSRITDALERLDSTWIMSPEKFRLAPGAIKKRAGHESLRTSWENLLRGISDELDSRT